MTKVLLLLLIFITPGQPPMRATVTVDTLETCLKEAGNFLAQGPQLFDAVAISAVCEVQLVGSPA